MIAHEEVAAVVGEENALSAAEAGAYSINAAVPDAVAVPGTREEAAALILRAGEEHWSLVPWGGGTQMELGAPARGSVLVLSTRRLNRVVDYQPDDMTVTVEAGVTLAELEALLSGRGQFLPLNPPLPERATVGGTVASAAAGPWRAGYGTPRDWVIGLRVLGADGKEVRGGGQVVKNVAGYDLPKLYTGSFGTLGLLTEVTFKVLPRPPHTGYCSVGLRSAAEVEVLLAAVMGSDLQPAALDLSGHSAAGEEGAELDRPWTLDLQFLHVEEAVRWQLERTVELAEAAGGRAEILPADRGEEALVRRRDLPASVAFAARIGTVSTRVADLAETASRLCREQWVPAALRAHAATGQIHVCAGEEASVELAEALRAAAAEVGATCVFPHLPGPLIGTIDPWGPVGPELRVMESIKTALDPGGTFSPGRFIDGLRNRVLENRARNE